MSERKPDAGETSWGHPIHKTQPNCRYHKAEAIETIRNCMDPISITLVTPRGSMTWGPCEGNENTRPASTAAGADWEIPMAKIVQDSDANLLLKVRDMFVKDHPTQSKTQQVYFGAFLSRLASTAAGEGATPHGQDSASSAQPCNEHEHPDDTHHATQE